MADMIVFAKNNSKSILSPHFFEKSNKITGTKNLNVQL